MKMYTVVLVENNFDPDVRSEVTITNLPAKNGIEASRDALQLMHEPGRFDVLSVTEQKE